MAADGSDVRHVTSGRGYDSGPVWSPDGSRIVFTSDRSLDHHGPMTKTGDSPVTSSVFVVSAEGGPLTSVASLPDGGVATSWIPGGVPPLATIDTTGTVTGTFRFSKVQASPSHDGFGPSYVHVSFDARWAGDSTPRAQVCTETLTDPAGRVVARQSGSFSAGEGRFTSSWDVRRSSMIAHVDRRDILTLHASIRCTNPNPPGWNVVTASSPSSTS